MSKNGNRKQMGGFREGSGRNPLFGKRMVQSSISLPEDVVEQIDALRADDESRAELIRKWVMAKARREAKKLETA